MKFKREKTYMAKVSWLGSHPEPSFSVREWGFPNQMMKILNFSRGHVLRIPADLALCIEGFGVKESWKIRMSLQARRWAWRRAVRRQRPCKRITKEHRDRLASYLLNHYAIHSEVIQNLGTKNYLVVIDDHWTLRWNP